MASGTSSLESNGSNGEIHWCHLFLEIQYSCNFDLGTLKAHVKVLWSAVDISAMFEKQLNKEKDSLI